MINILEFLKIIAKVLIGLPVYYISIYFPKKKGLAVIGSSLGLHFADNSKYLYINHYTKEKNDLNLIWVTKNRDVVSQLQSMDLPVVFLYSFKGVYTVLRASKSYLSHQLDDINGALIGGSKIIQLWHGMPLKKIGYRGDWTDNDIKGKFKVFIFKWIPYSYYMKCDILFAPCQEAKNTYLESFSKSFRNSKVEENILLVKQARTLCFDNDFVLTKDFFPEIELLNSLNDKYDKIISWLPTHRIQLNKTILDVILESSLDLEELNGFLKSKNYLFVIKPHFIDFNKLTNLTQGFDFICVYPHVDPYPLLKFTNTLITDYSSVFFDFLITGKEIIFMCHDFQEYVDKMGAFYYDYKNLNIGPICNSWDEIIKLLLNETTENLATTSNDKNNKFNFVANYDLNIRVFNKKLSNE
jgi:CDP-glycerol glycerophosphotransferase (TagB/SpsB family)